MNKVRTFIYYLILSISAAVGATIYVCAAILFFPLLVAWAYLGTTVAQWIYYWTIAPGREPLALPVESTPDFLAFIAVTIALIFVRNITSAGSSSFGKVGANKGDAA